MMKTMERPRKNPRRKWSGSGRRPKVREKAYETPESTERELANDEEDAGFAVGARKEHGGSPYIGCAGFSR